MNKCNLIALAIATAALIESGASPADADWPQRRGPNRDGVVGNSPKLMDAWPKDGPPMLWKSAWIPGYDEGGSGDPVVAGGRVFVYSNVKPPEDSDDGYRFVTEELLLDAGWLPDLPADLAKKIEDAWASTNRPSSKWQWYNFDVAHKAGALDEFLGKAPELEKYIKDFVSSLDPADAARYGDYIRRRLCIGLKGGFGAPAGVPWDKLRKIRELRETRYRTRDEWGAALDKFGAGSLCSTYPTYHAWKRTTKRSDTVFCLDALTGKTIWQKDFPADPAVIPQDDASCPLLGACGTPAVSGERCFVSGSMGVYCLSVKDGALQWQAKGEFAHSALLVADGVVYDNGRGCAYNAGSGALVWRNPFSPQRHLKPCNGRATYWNVPILWSSGDANYVIAHDGGEYFACLEMKTGKSLWNVKGPTGWFPNLRGDTLVMPIPWPSLGGAPKELGGTKAFRLTPTGAELLWRKSFSDYEGDAIHQDYLYMVRQCVDLKTGEVNWKDRAVYTVSPPLVAEGKVIAQLEGPGRGGWTGGAPIVMFKATPEKYIELGKFNAQASMLSSPAFSDGRLFVRQPASVSCYDLREHGAYLAGVFATRNALSFQFQQTGGGLVGDVKDVQITTVGGTPAPAKAQTVGETIVVDTADVPAPFEVTCPATNGLSCKNGKPVPAFAWRVARSLKFRRAVGNALILESERPLLPEGQWNKPQTYTVAGAKVTDVVIDPRLQKAMLTTDQAWKPGDPVALTYANYPVNQGEPRRETLKATVVAYQPAAATFVKTDTTTLGNWKGAYGKDGAMIAWEKDPSIPAWANVTVRNADRGNWWAARPTEERYLFKSAEAKDRTITQWVAESQMELAVDLKDGKEHQIAVYYLGTSAKGTAKAEILDAETQAVLDTQPLDLNVGSVYLTWQVKGNVVVRFSRLSGGEGAALWAGGLFFDPAGRARWTEYQSATDISR